MDDKLKEIGKVVGFGGMLLLWHIILFILGVGIIAVVIMAFS